MSLNNKTYFLDIDGTLLHHGHDLVGMMMGELGGSNHRSEIAFKVSYFSSSSNHQTLLIDQYNKMEVKQKKR